jgi:hypothetical protein
MNEPKQITETNVISGNNRTRLNILNKWAKLGLNQWPPAYQAVALPLSYKLFS